MKTIYITLIALLSATLSFAQKTIVSPDYTLMYSNKLSLDKVLMTKDSATLYLHSASKSFAIAPSIYLSDETGKRYKALRSSGFNMGDYVQNPKEEVRNISITFEPLPLNTRVFDCVEGSCNDGRAFRFLGIREKGQSLDIFPQSATGIKEVPFQDAWFRVDTVYVTGKIVNSKYDRLKQEALHARSYYEEVVSEGYRQRGTYPGIYVKKDGTFTFKTLVSKPVIDNLHFYGSTMSVMLIPGDHLEMEISHLGEYNQKVTYKSQYGDYNQLLNYNPFTHDYHADRSSLNLPLDEAFWDSFREKRDNQLAISKYISQKYHFSPTEEHIMQLYVLGNNACQSVELMENGITKKSRERSDAFSEKYENYWIMPERGPHIWLSLKEIEENNIKVDFTFLRDCSFNDPWLSVTTNDEEILRLIPDLFHHIDFGKKNDGGIDKINQDALFGSEFVGMKDAYSAIQWFWENDVDGKRVVNRVDGFDDYAHTPYNQLLSDVTRLSMELDNDLVDKKCFYKNYPAAPVVDQLVKQHPGRRLVLFPIYECGEHLLANMDSLYRKYPSVMNQIADIIPLATERLISNNKLQDMQARFPLLLNTVMLKEEDYIQMSSLYYSASELHIDTDGSVRFSRNFFSEYCLNHGLAF